MNKDTKEKLETYLWDAKKHLLAVSVTIAMLNEIEPELWVASNACLDVVDAMIKVLKAYDLDTANV